MGKLTSSLEGNRFGKVSVLYELGRDRRRRRVYWCQCECGNKFQRRHDNLLHGGENQSCFDCVKVNTPIDPSLWPVVEEHYEWAKKILRRWNTKYPQYRDEILSAMHEGLVIAVRDYRPEHGGDFRKWCIYRIYRVVGRTIFQVRRFEAFRMDIINSVKELSWHANISE